MRGGGVPEQAGRPHLGGRVAVAEGARAQLPAAVAAPRVNRAVQHRHSVLPARRHRTHRLQPHARAGVSDLRLIF